MSYERVVRNKKLFMEKWFVYILECEDKSFYTGITNDVQRRFNEHKSGKGGKYTNSHKPIKIIFTEEIDNKSEALKREYQIKSLSRENKKKLIFK